MIPRLFTLVAVLSLLLFVAAVGIWGWSYYRPTVVERDHFLGWTPVSQHGRTGVFSRIRHDWTELAWGQMEIHHGDLWQFGWSPPIAAELARWNHSETRRATWYGHLRGPWFRRNGFTWQWSSMSDAVPSYPITAEPRMRMVGAPLWAVAVLSAILPISWTASEWRRRHRAKLLLCASCGYDLRASADRCPECGTPIVPG